MLSTPSLGEELAQPIDVFFSVVAVLGVFLVPVVSALLLVVLV
jgi:hypothetical protein